jgi:hypothetical protein
MDIERIVVASLIAAFVFAVIWAQGAKGREPVGQTPAAEGAAPRLRAGGAASVDEALQAAHNAGGNAIRQQGSPSGCEGVVRRY